MRDCPLCGCTIEHIGSVGVTVHDRLDTQADRYDCPEGHTWLLVDLKGAFEAHQAADPHCTCNDCMDDFEKGDA